MLLEEQILNRAIDYAIESNYAEFDVVLNRIITAKKAKDLAAFGMGKFFRDAFPYMNAVFPIKHLVDNNSEKWGQKEHGLICEPPESLIKTKPLVVIMTGNAMPIKQQLKKMGIQYVTINDVVKNMYTEKHDANWFSHMRKDIIEGLNFFEDKPSRDIYVKAICDRIAPSLCDVSWSTYQTEGEYFNVPFWKLGAQEGYLDIGAFTGDTIEAFWECVNRRYNFLFGFELDSKIFHCMEKNISQKLGPRDRLLNLGVSDETIKDSGYIKIDDCVFPGKVTFVKMDIEGYEERCIIGARQLIHDDSPKMAICVYHRLEDLWNIPKLVREINPQYRLLLRHHSPCIWDTVCYAYV